MKRKLFLILICLVIGCGGNSRYSKKDALKQSFDCLRIKNEIGRTSNLRNPYIVELADILNNHNEPTEALLEKIRALSHTMRVQISSGKQLVKYQQPKHKDPKFYKATLEFLKINEKLESKLEMFVQGLIDNNLEQNKMDNLKNEVVILANDVVFYQREYVLKESEFHNENNILQKEVDSIVSVIKNK